jgi:hypothetical protein
VVHRRIRLLACTIAVAAVALSLGGCSGKRQYDVTGQVKYNGAPLAKPNGQIIFVGPDGTQVAASINEDGTYKAPKVAAGMNKVAVYYPNPAFKKAARPRGEPDPKYKPPSEPLNLTPEKYADVDNSGLSIQVAQTTVFNVELTGPPIP